MVEMAMFNFQRAITAKVGKQELQFMCFACHLIVLYIFVKFGENISDGIRYWNDGCADGGTDTQNFRRYNIIP